LRKIEFVVTSAVVLPEENLVSTPRALDGIRVCPGVRIDKVNAVVHGLMRVTVTTETAVRTPTITNDLSAGFDPVKNDSRYCVGGSVFDGNKKCIPRLSFQTAEHPLTLNSVSFMIFSPTELAHVNFDGNIRTTNLDRAALQKHQHGFPAEHAPVCDRMTTEAIFILDLVGWLAAHDVVCEQDDFLESEVTQLNHGPCLMDVSRLHLVPATLL
jgi:hypothetical protein